MSDLTHAHEARVDFYIVETKRLRDRRLDVYISISNILLLLKKSQHSM